MTAVFRSGVGGRGAAPVRAATAVLLAALLLLTACGKRPPPDPAARYRLAAGPCYAALAERGVAFEPLGALGRGACAVPAPIRLEATTAVMHEPVLTSCTMALALHDFEVRVVQPLARRHFGVPVVRLQHYGSYGCRRIQGGRGSWSLHARGLAVDIAGFGLADGRLIRVDRHWRGAGAASAFLHDVARSACNMFGVTLTPHSDRAHRDHLHLDIGPHWHCGY